MATVKVFIRTIQSSKSSKNVNVRFRLTDGRNVQLLYKSNIKVTPKQFDAIMRQSPLEPTSANKQQYETYLAIAQTKQQIEAIYYDRHPQTSAELKQLMDMPRQQGLFELFSVFVHEKARVVSSVQTYRNLYQCLIRYEAYKHLALTVSMLTKELVIDFEQYMQDEWKILQQEPRLLQIMPPKKPVKPRGLNTIAKQMKSLSVFCNWLVKNEYIPQNPLLLYRRPTQVYGTPFFLTITERNTIYNLDYDVADLNKTRDIFIFQCLIGCRVSDLFKLKKGNIKGDFLEYIPKKTSKECPKVVRVPLCNTAKQILQKYNRLRHNAILPSIYQQKYNEHIRNLIRLAGIDRVVTVLDSQTRQEINRPIYEVASSHMARRTFIGNLYNKIQDPNLIASMSGHTDGSRAFARYRTINDEVKINVIGLLE